MEEVEETTGSNRYGRRDGAMARMSMKRVYAVSCCAAISNRWLERACAVGATSAGQNGMNRPRTVRAAPEPNLSACAIDHEVHSQLDAGQRHGLLRRNGQWSPADDGRRA